MIVVDMQAGLLNGPPKHDLPGVIDRINLLTAMVRRQPGRVVWIRHCGRPGDGFEPGTPGWEFLPALVREPADIVIEKRLNDPFAGTALQQTLDPIAPDRVLVAGWATDFCVDATVRSAVAHNHHVVVVSDGHTLSDRPHCPDGDAASPLGVERTDHRPYGSHRDDAPAARSERLADRLIA